MFIEIANRSDNKLHRSGTRESSTRPMPPILGIDRLKDFQGYKHFAPTELMS